MSRYIVTELGKRIHMLLSDTGGEYFPKNRGELFVSEYICEWILLETLGIFVCYDDISYLQGDSIEYTHLLAELCGEEESFYRQNPQKLEINKQFYLYNLMRISAIVPTNDCETIVPANDCETIIRTNGKRIASVNKNEEKRQKI